jgi:uncharacterized membrane protein YqjE
MLILALVLFILAAALGLSVARQLLLRRETSKPVALAHGLAGAAGLAVLAWHAFSNPHRLLTTAILLLVVAALGGAWLLANDLRKKPGPLALVAIHALAAVAAVVLVLLVALG